MSIYLWEESNILQREWVIEDPVFNFEFTVCDENSFSSHTLGDLWMEYLADSSNANITNMMFQTGLNQIDFYIATKGNKAYLVGYTYV